MRETATAARQAVPVARTSLGSRIIRASGRVALGLLATFVLVVLAGIPLYAMPSSDRPESVDLVYVIGPPTEARLELAQELVDEGIADQRLVIGYRKGNGLYEIAEMPVCREPRVTCEVPHPSSTKGEALILQRFAPEHGIESTIVITFNPHVARTRYIFDKCYDGEVTVIGVAAEMTLGDWAYQYAYQSAAFVKAWATPCADEE